MNIFDLQKILTGGDWIVFYKETISQLKFFPQVWSSTSGNGLGQNVSFILGYRTFFADLAKFFGDVLNLDWFIVERLIFFVPFWIISILSSYYLSKKFFNIWWQNLLSVIVFSFNTYSLMLVGGGQMGVALSYAITPLIIRLFLNLYEKPTIRNSVISGIFLGLQTILDPRLAIVSIIFYAAYILVMFLQNRKFYKPVIILSLVSLLVVFLLNLFWILPFLLVKNVTLSDAYTSVGIVKFLSFATFENTISILHPNWPENIFGKIGFMRPEFILIPILAFSALLFKKEKRILSLSFIALVGSFLAKGTNFPLGEIYFWMSQKIPLFTIFRDATKWYGLTIVSYTILIPLAVLGISIFLEKINKYFSKIFIVLVFVYLIFIVRPLLLGQLTGTFEGKVQPTEYTKLSSFIVLQNKYFRTFWLPTTSRFGYFSNLNPYVSATDFLNSSELTKIEKFINSKDARKSLDDIGVKYIIVPDDLQKEIFLKDRKYDAKSHSEIINFLEKIKWLKRVNGFDNIAVFETPSYENLFFSRSPNMSLNYKILSPTEYDLDIKGAKENDVIYFSQNYDSKWKAIYKNNIILSNSFGLHSNSFRLTQPGSYRLRVFYAPQTLASIGFVISFGALIISIALITFGFKLRK